MANIILTGFMATGKSSAGRLLSKELGLKFVDMDELIEKEAGLRVREIFETFGEDRFRAFEKEAVKKLCQGAYGEGLIVSTGGGVVKDEENRRLLKQWGTVICLKASVDEILKRVGDRTDRPLLNSSDRKDRIERLLTQRESAYGDCHYFVDTTGLAIEKVVESIKGFLKKAGK